MMGIRLELVGREFQQLIFDFPRVLAWRDTRAVSDAKDVRIDRDSVFAKCVIEEYVSRLTPDTRQRL